MSILMRDWMHEWGSAIPAERQRRPIGGWRATWLDQRVAAARMLDTRLILGYVPDLGAGRARSLVVYDMRPVCWRALAGHSITDEVSIALNKIDPGRYAEHLIRGCNVLHGTLNLDLWQKAFDLARGSVIDPLGWVDHSRDVYWRLVDYLRRNSWGLSRVRVDGQGNITEAPSATDIEHTIEVNKVRAGIVEQLVADYHDEIAGALIANDPEPGCPFSSAYYAIREIIKGDGRLLLTDAPKQGDDL